MQEINKLRLSRRSVHSASHHSLKKMQLLAQSSSLNAEEVNGQRVRPETIMDKLLQPPQEKASIRLQIQKKKYEPKFQKPDVENLIQQNTTLKTQLQSCNKIVSALRIKNTELQRKLKGFEKSLVQQYDQGEAFENSKGLFQGILSMKNKDRLDSCNEKQNSSKDHALGGFSKSTNEESASVKSGPIYTQILKKKISDISNQYTAAEKQLKVLKKLPVATIYEENDIEKEHLIAQTVRLKAIITSVSQDVGFNSQESDKFQNQFMRLMKEENEKLKATIRLLQNDKILLKSRQTIQGKQNSDLKKQVQGYKQRILYKEAEIEKLNHQNKNLLFKKTSQFRLEQENMENNKIQSLIEQMDALRAEKRGLQESNLFYSEENQSLKEKEKNCNNEKNELESRYEKIIKDLREKYDELESKHENLKNDYLICMSATSSLKKKRSFRSGFNINNQNGGRKARDSLFVPNSLNFRSGVQSTDDLVLPEPKLKKASSRNESTAYSRPVKWDDVLLGMMHLYVSFELKEEANLGDFVANLEEGGLVRYFDLVSAFVEEPFSLRRSEAVKVARYITENNNLEKIEINEEGTVESSLVSMILKSSFNLIDEHKDEENRGRWVNIFKKSKKIFLAISDELEQANSIEDCISREDAISIISKHIRVKPHQVIPWEYLTIRFFSKEFSSEQIFLEKTKMLQHFQELSR